MRAKLRHADRQTDGHDESQSHFSWLCKLAWEQCGEQNTVINMILETAMLK